MYLPVLIISHLVRFLIRCFPCGVLQYSLSNNKWNGKCSRIFTSGEEIPTNSLGFYSRGTICQQYIWGNAVCRLGQIERSTVACRAYASIVLFSYLRMRICPECLVSIGSILFRWLSARRMSGAFIRTWLALSEWV